MLLAGPQASQAAGAGPPPWVLPVVVGGVLLCGIILLLLALRKRNKRPAMAPCKGCGRMVPAAWDKCRFCGVATRDDLDALRLEVVGDRVEDVFLVSSDALASPKTVLQVEQDLLKELQISP